MKAHSLFILVTSSIIYFWLHKTIYFVKNSIFLFINIKFQILVLAIIYYISHTNII